MYVLHTPQIDWLEAALATAPSEEQGRIGRWLERAVMEHDKLLLDNGLGHTTQDAPDGLPEVPVFTRCEQIHVFFISFLSGRRQYLEAAQRRTRKACSGKRKSCLYKRMEEM